MREDFHFTSLGRRNDLYSAFQRSGRPEDLGVFFHAQQDSYSHAGYSARFGHLFMGHEPDLVGSDPVKADLMAKDTFDRLIAAKGRLGQSYQGVAWKAIFPLIQQYNRNITVHSRQETLRQLQKLVRSKINEQEERENRQRKAGGCSAEFATCE